jgi:KUP system potassium uptake protein
VVIPIAIAILAVLFVLQRRGTHKIGRVFGPIMIVWFTVLALLGIVQIVQDPGVLRALDPTTPSLLHRVQLDRFWALGSIFLVVTGGEALYADMGHFGRSPIPPAGSSMVLPALLLNYFGQGALLLDEPEAIESPFFSWDRRGRIWPLVCSPRWPPSSPRRRSSPAPSPSRCRRWLDYLPRLKVGTHRTTAGSGLRPHRELDPHGRMHRPGGRVRLVENLAAAYGIAVTMTMAHHHAAVHGRRHPQLGLVPDTDVRHRHTAARHRPRVLLRPDREDPRRRLVRPGDRHRAVHPHDHLAHGAHVRRPGDPARRAAVSSFVEQLPDMEWSRVPGTAAFLFKDAGATPPALIVNMQHNKVLHEQVLLLSIETADQPTVPEADRWAVTKVGPGMWQVVLTFGFMDQPDVPRALASIDHPRLKIDPAEITYFLGRETIVTAPRRTMHAYREELFILQNRTAASAARFFGLPSNLVFEVGTTVEI